MEWWRDGEYRLQEKVFPSWSRRDIGRRDVGRRDVGRRDVGRRDVGLISAGGKTTRRA